MSHQLFYVLRPITKRRDLDRALRLSRRSLELINEPESPMGRMYMATYSDTLAEILYLKEELAEALALQRRAVELAEALGLDQTTEELRARLAKITQAYRQHEGYLVP